GVAGFEPTTTCPPDKCATRLRYTPGKTSALVGGLAIIPVARPAGESGSAPQQLQHFLQLHAHLAHDLAAQCRLLPGAVAFQAEPRTADGVALFVQQAADLAHHQHVVALVVAAVAATLDRAEAGELCLQVAQHVRLGVAQLADLADGEVALGRDWRKLAIAARIKHSVPPRRRLPRAPSASAPGGRSPRCVRR